MHYTEESRVSGLISVWRGSLAYENIGLSGYPTIPRYWLIHGTLYSLLLKLMRHTHVSIEGGGLGSFIHAAFGDCPDNEACISISIHICVADRHVLWSAVTAQSRSVILM